MSPLVLLNESNNGNNSDTYTPIATVQENEGVYRPFLNYAWDKLSSSNLIHSSTSAASTITKEDDDKIYNSSPSKGPDGTVVNVEIQSINGIDSLRLARYALLETMTPSTSSVEGEKMISLNQGIHVLNLVLFPNVSEQYAELPIPILGMDLVTLPGGKHLIAIDFQPILPIQSDQSDDHTHIFPQGGDDNDNNISNNYNEVCTKYENKIQEIHEKYVLNYPDQIQWGGDIPSKAKRFFSPYALWTRLKDDDGLDIIRNQIYIAFCAYFDLYIELLEEVQQIIIDMGDDEEKKKDVSSSYMEKVMNGHRDYLTYRKENDPARPMLTRLYGNDWTEEIISDVLFKMI